MPVALFCGPFRFHFYSVDRAEPMHVHVTRDDDECKFWLEPTIKIANNDQFSKHELRRIEKLVHQHRQLIVEKWHEHFNR